MGNGTNYIFNSLGKVDVDNRFYSDSTRIQNPNWLGSAGLLWPDMIEPITSTVNTSLGPGGRHWYIDRDAATGGDGSESTPYKGFAQVFGYYSGGNYQQGSVGPGDIVHLKGTFKYTEHIEGDADNHLRINMSRADQGADGNPVIVKAWLGQKAKFDGEYDTGSTSLVNIRDSGDIIYQNIEITGCYALAFVISGENGPTTAFEGINLWIHDNWGYNTGGSSIGGIALGFVDGASKPGIPQKFVMRNCLVHDNDKDNVGATILGHDNQGEIRYLANNGAAINPGSYFKVYDSIIKDGGRAIGGKHSNDVDFEMYNCHIDNCEQVIYQRAWDVIIRDNLITTIKGAIEYGASVFYMESLSISGDQTLTIYNNTLWDIRTKILSIGHYNDQVSAGSPNWARNAIIYNNAIHAGSETGLGITIGNNDSAYNGTGTVMPLTSVVSHHNVIFYADANNDFLHMTNRVPSDEDFADAMSSFGDASTVFGDPGYTDAANGNFTPTPGSLLIDNADDGGNIGAF